MTQHSSDSEQGTHRRRRVQRSRLLLSGVVAGIALLASCSFQDFDVLQDGGALGASGGFAGDTGSGGKDTSSAGSNSGGSNSGGSHAGGSNSGGSNSGGSNSGGSHTGGTGSSSAVGGMGGMGGEPSTPGSLLSSSVLENGSFEGSMDGWTVVPASAISARHIYVEAPTGTVAAPDGVYQLASWHGTDKYEVTLSQQVDGLEDGTYTLQGYFMRGPGMSVQMFARNCSPEDPAPVVIPATATSAFTPFTLSGVEVVGGSCEVGLEVSNAAPGQWMNADVITLTKE